jgi:hypothetical protein
MQRVTPIIAKPRFTMTELAKRGAEVVFNELNDEAAQLRRQFPGIQLQVRSANPPHQNGATQAPAAEPAAPTTRRRMSAAARRVVSERMKKYWAERRKAKARGKQLTKN